MEALRTDENCADCGSDDGRRDAEDILRVWPLASVPSLAAHAGLCGAKDVLLLAEGDCDISR